MSSNGDHSSFQTIGAKVRGWIANKSAPAPAKQEKPKRRAVELLGQQEEDVDDFRDVLFEAYRKRLAKKATSMVRAQAMWYDKKHEAQRGDEIKNLQDYVSLAEALDRVSRLTRSLQWYVCLYELDLIGNESLVLITYYTSNPSTRELKVEIESTDPALKQMLRTIMAMHESKGIAPVRATQTDRKRHNAVIPNWMSAPDADEEEIY